MQTAKTYDALFIHPQAQVSLGLFYITSLLSKNGFSVRVISGTYKSVTETASTIFKQGLANEKTIIGLSATTDSLKLAQNVCEYVKKNISPKIFCAIGGFQVTALPKETIKNTNFDIGIVGEAELTILELMTKIKNNEDYSQIKGTCIKKNNNIILNASRELIEDLDILPSPYAEMDNIDGFKTRLGGHPEIDNAIQISASRGCPYTCVFCDSKIMWTQRIRFHSVEYIVNEIIKLHEKFKINGIKFFDDEFLVNKEFTKKLCQELINKGINKIIKWECQARVSSIDEGTIKQVKSAGCVSIRFGIESGSQNSLDFLKKKTIKIEQAINAIQITKKYQIWTFGSFIIGAPDETKEDILKTIDFIVNNDLDGAYLMVLMPYPGTDAAKIYAEKNYINKNEDWNKFQLKGAEHQVLIKNKNFSSEQLNDIQNYVNKKICQRLQFKWLIPNYHSDIKKIINRDKTPLKNTTADKIIAFKKRTDNYITKILKK